MKCRTAIKSLFLYFNLCDVQCWIVSPVHLHSYPVLLIYIYMLSKIRSWGKMPKYENHLRSNGVHKLLPDIIFSPQKWGTDYSPVICSNNRTPGFHWVVYVLKCTTVSKIITFKDWWQSLFGSWRNNLNQAVHTVVAGYARVCTTWLRLFRMNRTNNFDQSL